MVKRFLLIACLAAGVLATGYATRAEEKGVGGVSASPSPTPASTEELTQAMGGSVWKLHITLPDSQKNANAKIYVRDHSGKMTFLVGSPTVISAGNTDLLIAMLPAPDDVKNVAQKRFSVVSGFGATTGVLPDPFTGLNTYRANPPKEVSPGIFELVRAAKGDAFKDTPEKAMELHIVPTGGDGN